MSRRIIIRAGMELIDGKKCRIEEAIELIKKYSLQEAIDWLSRINAFLWKENEIFNEKVQWKLVIGLCKKGGRLYRKITDNPQIRYNINKGVIVLFDEVQVLNAVKLALINCQVQPLPDKSRDSNNLARALIIINDHLEYDGKDDSDKNWVLRNLLPEMLFREVNSANRRTMARWEYMFYDIPNRSEVKCSQRYRDIETLFKDVTGVSIQVHRALVMGLLSIFYNLIKNRNIAQQPLFVNWNAWKKDFVLSDEEEKYLFSFCAEVEVIKTQFVKNSDRVGVPYYFLPLRQKPVVKIGDLLWCPSISFLIEKMSIGIYHELFTRFVEQGDSAKRELLSTFLGYIFELYTLEMLKYAFSSNSMIQIHRLDECDPKNKKKCDMAIPLGKDLVLIECKSHLFTQQSSVQANISNFEKEIKMVILDGSKQIKTTIDRIESGDLVLPDIALSNIDSYVPIILTLQYIPVNRLTSEIIKESISESGLNTISRKSIEIQLIDITALEVLAPHIAKGLSLIDLVRDKIRQEVKTNDKQSVWDFFTSTNHDIIPNQFLEPIEKRILETSWSFWEKRKNPSK